LEILAEIQAEDDKAQAIMNYQGVMANKVVYIWIFLWREWGKENKTSK